jgi:menaquinone-dependent protoporphyrinogen IX oxidase
MRIAVVYFGEKEKKRLAEVAQALATGLEGQGAQVEVYDFKDLSRPLSLFQFLVVGTENQGSFGGKIPAQLTHLLKNAGTLGSKRCCAFVIRRGFRVNKAMLSLMKLMEKEGMFVVNSAQLLTTDEARSFGKTLNIEHKR